MNFKPVLSFVGALLITGTMLALCAILCLLMTFDLAGGETWMEEEVSQNMQLILAVVVAGVACYLMWRYARAGKRYTGYGVAVIPVVCLVAATVSFVQHYHYHTPFDKEEWRKATPKPENMAVTLLRSGKLAGLSRAQTTAMLGNGQEDRTGSDREYEIISYAVENEYTPILIFDKGKVMEVILRKPGLMT